MSIGLTINISDLWGALTDIIGLLCKQKGFRGTSKGRARPDRKFERVVVRASGTRHTRATSRTSYGVLLFPPIRCIGHTLTDRPSFIHLMIVGQFYWFKWQQLGYGKFYGGEIVAAHKHKFNGNG